MSGPTRELLARGLHALRRSALWWGVGIAVFTIMNVAFWPSFEGSSALADLQRTSEDLLRAFGAQNIATPSGYLDGQVFALFLPLLLSGLAIAGITAVTAGDEDAGRMELLLALPVGRRAVWFTRFASMVAVVAIVTAVIAVLTLAALPVFSLEEAGAGRVLAATAASGLLAVLHGSIGYLAGALGARRALAAGIAIIVLAAGYVVSFVLPLEPSLRWARRASPWWWGLGQQPVSDGLDPVGLLIVLVVIVAAVALGTLAIERRDVRSA